MRRLHVPRMGLLGMLLLALLLTGCGLQIPSDPWGTTDRITGGTLRAGVTHHPPWTSAEEGRAPAGPEVELVMTFAAERDADVAWTVASESELVDQLERGELDVVVGGFVDPTPWSERVGVTRAYTETVNAEGKTVRHIMLTRMGENRFLVLLEAFLDEVAAP